MKGRTKIPEDLAGLLRSEWTVLISEAAMCKEDEQIARLCLVDKLPQLDAAMEIGMDRGTVSSRLPGIIYRLQYTMHRMGIQN